VCPLDAPDMQFDQSAELNLRPFQVGDLDRAQTMAITGGDQGGISSAPAAGLGRFDQLVDLGRQKVFPRSGLRIGPAA
jgi:hypothetical protein